PLRWGFIAFVLLSGAMLFVTVPNRDALFELSATTAALLIGLGLLMGIAAGLFGIGGGVIVIPALMLFLGQSDLVAKSVSLLAMAPGSISGSLSHLRYETASLRDGAWVSLGAIATTPVGALVAFGLSAQAAAILFGALTLFVAVNLIYRALKDRRNP
ncbi:MAG: sulfite exporter TauE/SafE family protein, partial [Pontimonas sp.]